MLSQSTLVGRTLRPVFSSRSNSLTHLNSISSVSTTTNRRMSYIPLASRTCFSPTISSPTSTSPLPHRLFSSTNKTTNTQPRPKVVVISGGTGVGKTAASVSLAKALGGEIVSADSMQVYEGFDIGTAKVMLNEIDDVPHHLVDCSPMGCADFSAPLFYHKALSAIHDITNRGKVAVVIGGTGMYLRWLLYGRPTDMNVAPTPQARDTAVGLCQLLCLAPKPIPISASVDTINRLEVTEYVIESRTTESALSASGDAEPAPSVDGQHTHEPSTSWHDVVTTRLQQLQSTHREFPSLRPTPPTYTDAVKDVLLGELSVHIQRSMQRHYERDFQERVMRKQAPRPKLKADPEDSDYPESDADVADPSEQPAVVAVDDVPPFRFPSFSDCVHRYAADHPSADANTLADTSHDPVSGLAVFSNGYRVPDSLSVAMHDAQVRLDLYKAYVDVVLGQYLDIVVDALPRDHTLLPLVQLYAQSRPRSEESAWRDCVAAMCARLYVQSPSAFTHAQTHIATSLLQVAFPYAADPHNVDPASLLSVLSLSATDASTPATLTVNANAANVLSGDVTIVGENVSPRVIRVKCGDEEYIVTVTNTTPTPSPVYVPASSFLPLSVFRLHDSMLQATWTPDVLAWTDTMRARNDVYRFEKALSHALLTAGSHVPRKYKQQMEQTLMASMMRGDGPAQDSGQYLHDQFRGRGLLHDFDVRCFFLTTHKHFHSRWVDYRCEQMVQNGMIKETMALINTIAQPHSQEIANDDALLALRNKTMAQYHRLYDTVASRVVKHLSDTLTMDESSVRSMLPPSLFPSLMNNSVADVYHNNPLSIIQTTYIERTSVLRALGLVSSVGDRVVDCDAVRSHLQGQMNAGSVDDQLMMESWLQFDVAVWLATTLRHTHPHVRLDLTELYPAHALTTRAMNHISPDVDGDDLLRGDDFSLGGALWSQYVHPQQQQQQQQQQQRRSSPLLDYLVPTMTVSPVLRTTADADCTMPAESARLRSIGYCDIMDLVADIQPTVRALQDILAHESTVMDPTWTAVPPVTVKQTHTYGFHKALSKAAFSYNDSLSSQSYDAHPFPVYSSAHQTHRLVSLERLKTIVTPQYITRFLDLMAKFQTSTRAFIRKQHMWFRNEPLFQYVCVDVSDLHGMMTSASHDMMTGNLPKHRRVSKPITYQMDQVAPTYKASLKRSSEDMVRMINMDQHEYWTMFTSPANQHTQLSLKDEESGSMLTYSSINQVFVNDGVVAETLLDAFDYTSTITSSTVDQIHTHKSIQTNARTFHGDFDWTGYVKVDMSTVPRNHSH